MATSPEYVFLTSRSVAALAFAIEAHDKQARKGADPVTYVAHLLGVASLVLEDGGSETEAIAGLLHDVLEDTDVTRQELVERYADDPRVVEIVEACTDELENRHRVDSPERKRRYLVHLREIDDLGVLRVSVADKLHNARTTVLGLRSCESPATYFEDNAFKVGLEGQLAWYSGLAEAFRASPLESPMVGELERLAGEMRDLTAA